MTPRKVETAVAEYVSGMPSPSDGLADWRTRVVSRSMSNGRTRRIPWPATIAAAVALLVIGALLQGAIGVIPGFSSNGYRTIQVNGLTIVQAAAATAPGPRLTRDNAGTIALAKFDAVQRENGTPGSPPIVGAIVSIAIYSPGVVKAFDPNGDGFLSSSSPMNAWIIGISAPPQNGFAHVAGFVVVNDDTQQVVGYSLLATN